MCNIAGYTGSKQAAPILIDMIKRQETLDGGLSTGIATIHNGKLYTAKVLGNADELVKNTDALNLPGTVGIIHSRPDNNYIEYAHPFVSDNNSCALVSNGNICTDESMTGIRNSVTEFLFRNGANFESAREYKSSAYPQLNDGRYVAYGEVFVKNVEYMVSNSNLDYAQAMANASAQLFSDVVNVLISAERANNIYVTRISRPMNVMVCENESYISTSQFGFPQVPNAKFMKSLPHMKCCIIKKGSCTESPYNVTSGEVIDYSEETYKDIKREISKKLKKAPASMDTMGGGIFTIDRNSPILSPHVKAVYDALWELHCEGILKTYDDYYEIPWVPDTKVKRTFFYI